MSIETRRCNVNYVCQIWACVKQLKKDGRNTLPNLIKMAIKNSDGKRISEKDVEKAIRLAVEDGLLEQDNGDGKKKTIYKLPAVDKITNPTLSGTDWYCYQCHNVDESELKVCECCTIRCFHAKCAPNNFLQDEVIINANKKRLTHVPLTTKTQNRPKSRCTSVARSEAGTTDTSVIDETLNEALQHDIIISLDSTAVDAELTAENGDQKLSCSAMSLKTESSPTDSKSEIKLDDVIFDKVLRTPDPKRSGQNNLMAKPEVVEEEEEMSEEEMMARYCLRCRTLKTSSFAKLQKQIDIEEMNNLLQFMFNRVKTWVHEDLFTQSSLSRKNPAITGNVDLIRAKLVKIPMDLKVIGKKLQNNTYDQVDQIYCDLLDISHNLAIIHGDKSAELESSKFLLNDTLFELSELKQCMDCYRHSNEKKDKNWFAKPCVPRHELVYAKQRGYEYWPAKVIRIFDGKYDVRFFGAGHTRAVIAPNFVRPIENPSTDEKHSSSFQTASRELEKHQELLAYPVGTFSYAETSKLTKKLPSKPGRKRASESVAKSDVEPAKNATTKRKGEVMDTLKAVKKPRADRKSIDTRQSRAQASNNSTQMNGSVAKRLRSKSRDLASTPEKTTESTTKGKRKMAVATKVAEDVRETAHKKRNKKISESRAEVSKSVPEQNEADSTLESTVEFFDLTNENMSYSDDDANSSLSLSNDAIMALQTRYKTCKTVEEIKQAGLVALRAQIQRHNQEIEVIVEQHKDAIGKAKSQEWCSSCEKESRYYCCWNTTYCSKECQQKHWQAGHKKMCRRKK